MALVARQLTPAEHDALLGVSPVDYAPEEGGLLQNTGEEFLTALRAWLREHHVDDWDRGGRTLLWYAAWGRAFAEKCAPPEDWVQLVRELLARGANPRGSSSLDDVPALTWACGSPTPLEMVPLLLDAGADVCAKADFGHKGKTALAFVFTDTYHSTRDTLKLVHMLLRAGATLDACCSNMSAEDLLDACCDPEPAKALLQRAPRWPTAYATNPHLTELKRVYHGIRSSKGSYARYVKKEVLVLLALVRKDRASTKWFYAGDHRTAFDILAKSPKYIAWHILSFSVGMSK